MSGPKSASFRVVSEAELRRRRVAELRARFERLRADALEAVAQLRLVADAHGDKVAAPSIAHAPDSEYESAWEDAIARVERDIVETHAAVAEVRRRAFSQMVAATLDVEIAARAPEDSARRQRRLEAEAVAEPAPQLPTASLDEVRAAAERLSGDASDDAVAEVERLVAAYCAAGSPQIADRAHSQLVDLVHRENRRVERAARNRERVEELHRSLDGLEGDDVERTRGLLRGLPLDNPLPPELVASVASVRDIAIAARDRQFALEAAIAAFEEIGYEVDERFTTAVVDDGALLTLPASERHAVRVRARDGQLQLNVVRLDAAGRTEQRDDALAEEAFCGDLDELRAAMTRRGIDFELRRADPPGARPVMVVPLAPRARHNRRPSKTGQTGKTGKTRERERERS